MSRENFGLKGIDQICFISDSTMVITFITSEDPIAVSRQSQKGEVLLFRLHALIVDMKTGNVTATRDWPSSSRRSRVLPVIGNNLTVLTPDRLFLYSTELSLVKQLDVPWGRESAKNQWGVSRSPGGKYLLASYKPESNVRGLNALPPEMGRAEPTEIRFDWVDLEDLQFIKRWITKECINCSRTVGISDGGVAQRWKNVLGGTPFDSKIVEIGEPPDGPWRDLCPYYEPYCRPGEFINNKSVLTITETRPAAIWLVSTNGGLLFHDEFREHETLYSEHHASWVASADGSRFAIAVMKIRGSNAFFDIGGHAQLDRVMVFDLLSRQWLSNLDATKQKIRDISGMALSPDGSLLALITQNGMLQVYGTGDSHAPSHRTQTKSIQ
jgi:hypothetical protein